MAKRYDVIGPFEYEKNGEKKTFWRQMGTGFATDDGKGIKLRLYATPVPGKSGMLELLIKAHEPRPQQQQQHDDDDIPF